MTTLNVTIAIPASTDQSFLFITAGKRKNTAQSLRKFLPLNETLQNAVSFEVIRSTTIGIDARENWIGSASLNARNGDQVWQLIEDFPHGKGSRKLAARIERFYAEYLSCVLRLGFAAYFMDRRVPILKLENCAVLTGQVERPIEIALLGPGFAALQSDRHASHSTARTVGSLSQLRSVLVSQVYNLHARTLINRVAGRRTISRKQLRRQTLKVLQRTICETGRKLNVLPVELENEVSAFMELIMERKEFNFFREELPASTPGHVSVARNSLKREAVA